MKYIFPFFFFFFLFLFCHFCFLHFLGLPRCIWLHTFVFLFFHPHPSPSDFIKSAREFRSRRRTNQRRQWLSIRCINFTRVCGSSPSLTIQRRSMALSLEIKRVLISDNLDKCCKDILEASGIAVDVKTKLTKEELLSEISVRCRIQTTLYGRMNEVLPSFDFISEIRWLDCTFGHKSHQRCHPSGEESQNYRPSRDRCRQH